MRLHSKEPVSSSTTATLKCFFRYRGVAFLYFFELFSAKSRVSRILIMKGREKVIFKTDKESIEVIHEEIQDDWKEIEIELDQDVVDKLPEIEEELSKNGLTLNDLFIAILKNEIKKGIQINED